MEQQWCSASVFDDDSYQTERENRRKWDLRFLNLAKHVSTWSKDNSTQVGCVIVDQDRRLVSVGYNGFPMNVQDISERINHRPTKLLMTVHAERNAILFAKRDLTNCVMYTWPFSSCAVCAGMVIQSGIKRCVAPETPDNLKERWGNELEIANIMFKEAGVKMDLYRDSDLENIQ